MTSTKKKSATRVAAPKRKRAASPVSPSASLRSGIPGTGETLALIAPAARNTVVDTVAERLRGEILSGRFVPGARLPAEREFAVALGVNRLSLRAALARLEALGLVVTKHGAGTVVTAWRESAGLDTLVTLIGNFDRADDAYRELLASFFEVRRIIAAEAVALAAERHVDRDLVVLRRLADEQKARLADVLGFARGDVAFQRALTRAARNVAFELVLNSFARFPDQRPEIVEKLYDRREDSLAMYDITLELVKSRNASAARDLVRQGFEAFDAEWMRRHFG